MELLGEKYGNDFLIKTCRISNARPIFNLEQLEQERGIKFLTLTNAKSKSNNRSPSPLKRKSVINYFDEMDERVRLKSLYPNHFRSSTTSSKPIRYIQKELRRVFNKLSIRNELKEEFSYVCKSSCVNGGDGDENGDEDDGKNWICFTVEIVNIRDFEHLKGIFIRHDDGEEEEFKSIHDLILQNLLI